MHIHAAERRANGRAPQGEPSNDGASVNTHTVATDTGQAPSESFTSNPKYENAF